MAILNLENTKLIVENAMRESGYKDDDIEDAWKDSQIVGGDEVDSSNNLQTMRDAIAQAIFDSLRAVSVSGDLSSGNNAPQSQTVTTSDEININGDETAPFAARVGDTITMSAEFTAWVAAVTLTLNGIPTPVPTLTSVSGLIADGSETVRIGD